MALGAEEEEVLTQAGAAEEEEEQEAETIPHHHTRPTTPLPNRKHPLQDQEPHPHKPSKVGAQVSGQEHSAVQQRGIWLVIELRINNNLEIRGRGVTTAAASSVIRIIWGGVHRGAGRARMGRRGMRVPVLGARVGGDAVVLVL